MATITTFKAGYCTHVSCVTVKGSGFGICQYPAQAFLIQANQRTWLWDTGYSSHFHDATQSGIFALYRKTTPVYYNDNENIALQLRHAGHLPQNLDGIILSHFHGDHIAGLKDFPDVPFICSGTGWASLRTKRGFSALRRGFVPALMPSDFESRVTFLERFTPISLPAALAPFTIGYALPHSNNEVILVELPGHAAGHIGAFVLTDAGWELIASDAGWSVQNYRDLKMPSRLANLIMDDASAFKETLFKLHQLDNNKIKIHLTHEETS